MENKKKAVVLFSGGLDSTTALAIAQSKGFECYCLSFDYGQKQVSELEAAAKIARQMGAHAHKIVQLDLSMFGGSALTDAKIDIPDFVGGDEIPVTYVPARNTIMLSVALGWAEILDAGDIFIGACEMDYSGYPDCRGAYFNAFQQLANLATKAGVEGQAYVVHTPLLRLSKYQTIQQGMALGVDYSLTVSCYRADAQGRACGRCDSCTYRARGFTKAKIKDPTRYQPGVMMHEVVQ